MFHSLALGRILCVGISCNILIYSIALLALEFISIRAFNTYVRYVIYDIFFF